VAEGNDENEVRIDRYPVGARSLFRGRWGPVAIRSGRCSCFASLAFVFSLHSVVFESWVQAW